jgi:hypothetical protein
MRKRLDIKKLESSQFKQEYKMELRNRFESLNHPDDKNIEETWSKIKDIYVKTAESALGFREIKKKDRMSKETWAKIQKWKNIKMMFIIIIIIITVLQPQVDLSLIQNIFQGVSIHCCSPSSSIYCTCVPGSDSQVHPSFSMLSRVRSHSYS